MDSRSSSPHRRVLIGFAESAAAIEAAWSLRCAGWHVDAFTRAGSRPAVRWARRIHVHHVTPPEIDADKCRSEVGHLAAMLRSDVLLPLDDAAVWVTGDMPSADVVVAGPVGDRVAVALDKSVQLDLARRAGFSVPDTTLIHDVAQLEGAKFPLFIKPADAIERSEGGLRRPHGFVATSFAEVTRVAPIITGPHLAQPVLQGRGEGVFGLARAGAVAVPSAHRRIRMFNPSGSGSSACESIDVDPTLLANVREFVRLSGWEGLFMLEMLRDTEGVPWFIEFNGRAWGSLALSRRRGFEYPAWAAASAVGEPLPEAPAAPPYRECRNVALELAHLAFVARGPSSGGRESWPRLGSTLLSQCKISRHTRLYNFDVHEPYVVLLDTAVTLADFAKKLRGR